VSRRALILEGALAGLVAIILVFLSGWSLRSAFERQKRHALERLQKPAVLLIQRSWHLKDDLAIQQVVTALGQAPGIYFACVIGPDGKIMAHSQPANVGQVYHRSEFPIAARPLEEGQKKWGTLVISASEKSQGCAWRHEMTLWGLGGTLLWLAWMARSVHWRRRLAEQDHQIADLLTLAEEQQQKEIRETEKQSQTRILWMSRLQKAMDRIPQGMLLLDQRQRVVAANSLAAQALGVANSESLAGKSWQEVPKLSSCGKELEKSLASPGDPVEWTSEKGNIRFLFETANDTETGTFITLSSVTILK
jgi:PAS domain-containing protein